MIFKYSISIFEERENGVYWVFKEMVNSEKEAVKVAKETIKEMQDRQAIPAGVTIRRKDVGGYTVPKTVFRYGKSVFNYMDFYL